MLAIEPIDLESSLNSGQVFLWEKIEDVWYGIDGHNVLAIRDNPLRINSFHDKASDFFRRDDDFKKIFDTVNKDPQVSKAIRHCPGLRILRQNPFQCYISFIVSSNSNIPRIQRMLQNLCRTFGEKIVFDEKEFYLFPKPEKLSLATRKDLSECGLGYRAEFVKKASADVVSGKIDFDHLKNCDYFEAKKSLLEVHGIGSKVADCIMLFSLEKLEAFPLDRWMLRILQKYFSEVIEFENKTITEKKYSEIHKKIVNHFGPYAGYAQQFLFKMERDVNQKKWL